MTSRKTRYIGVTPDKNGNAYIFTTVDDRMRCGITTLSAGDFNTSARPRERMIRLMTELNVTFGAKLTVLYDQRDRFSEINTFRPDKTTMGIETIETHGLIIDRCGLPHMKTVLMCPTADCPVMIIVADGGAGIFHCGWHNLLHGMVPTALLAVRNHFDVPFGRLKFYIWPGICPECYEVGPEFKSRFPFSYRTGYPPGTKNFDGRLDVAGELCRQLLEKKIDGGAIGIVTGYCPATYRNGNGYEFASFRRMGKDRINNVVFLVV